MVSSLFSISRQRISLMEAESKFTGKEIAYIYKAEHTFPRKGAN